eukprot:2568113-Prymnesium_polylepis.2
MARPVDGTRNASHWWQAMPLRVPAHVVKAQLIPPEEAVTLSQVGVRAAAATAAAARERDEATRAATAAVKAWTASARASEAGGEDSVATHYRLASHTTYTPRRRDAAMRHSLLPRVSHDLYAAPSRCRNSGKRGGWQRRVDEGGARIVSERWVRLDEA